MTAGDGVRITVQEVVDGLNRLQLVKVRTPQLVLEALLTLS